MTTDNAREAAQLVERDAPRLDMGTPRLLVAHVLGDPTERGFAFRALRLATAEDLESLGPALDVTPAAVPAPEAT